MTGPSRPRSSSASSKEAFGVRLARIRKARGLTQVDLARQVEMIQALISDYETGKLRPYADVVARFAQALSVSADELLGIAPPPKTTTSSDENPASRRFMRRAKLMTKLPKRDQDALLRTIDAVLKQIKETS